MIYRQEVTIPVGTVKSVPHVHTLKLTPGVIDNVQLTFPSGCAGLVGVRVKVGLFQLYPLSVGEWLVSDDFTIVFPEEFPLLDRPYTLTVEGYNEDDTYPHTVHAQVSVRMPKDLTAEVLALLRERLPVGLDTLIAAGVEVRASGEESIVMLREEMIPILQALLSAQTGLLQVEYERMTLEELARL